MGVAFQDAVSAMLVAADAANDISAELIAAQAERATLVPPDDDTLAAAFDTWIDVPTSSPEFTAARVTMDAELA